MELALHLGGGSADRLARDMTAREFREWGTFAKQSVLPSRRIEIYLAQIAWAVCRFMGGNDSAKIEDFLIEFGSSREAGVDVDALKAEVGFSPRKKVA